VGWHRGGLWHFTGDGFREACNGANVRATRRALREAGLLHMNKAGKMTSNLKVDGKAVVVTSVRPEIFEYPFSVGNQGNAGNQPRISGTCEVARSDTQRVTGVTQGTVGYPGYPVEDGMGNRLSDGKSREVTHVTPVTHENHESKHGEPEEHLESKQSDSGRLRL